MLIKPEDITYKVYSKLTFFRSEIFFLLLAFVVWTAADPRLHLVVSRDLFITALSAMIAILLAVGTLTAGFVTIVVEMVKNKTQNEVINLWSQTAKYIIYPFAVVVLSAIILFLAQLGISLSNTSSSLSILIFLAYLVAHSFFIIKVSEVLINENWSEQAKFKKMKEKFPPSKLNESFKLFEFRKQMGRVYIYDLQGQKRYWIHDPQTYQELGYEWGKWTTVEEGDKAPNYEHFEEGEDIIAPKN